MEKGLLTKERETFLIDLICSKITFKNKWVERFKRPAVRALIHYGDNSGLDQIPKEWKSDLMPIIDMVIEQDYENARRCITDLLNKKIDIKDMDEPTEIEAIDFTTKTVAIWARYFVDKKQKELTK